MSCPSMPRHSAASGIPRCLQVAEVVTLIVEELYKNRGYGSVVSLGQTCRLLFDPAMDSLWRDLQSTCPLLKTFPRDLWYVDDSAVKNRYGDFRQSQVLRFRRDMVPSDWIRFDVYAKRVRRLIMAASYRQPFGSVAVDEAVWACLVAQRPSAVLMPRLQILDWPFKLIPSRYVPLLASSTLRAITFYSVEEMAALASISVSSLTNLEKLELERWHQLRTTDGVEDAARALLKVVQGLPRLRVLTCPAFVVSQDTRLHLASAAYFVGLRITGGPFDLNDCRLPPDPFRTLTSLSIPVIDYASTAALLCTLEKSPLQRIEGARETFTDLAGLERLFRAVSAFRATLTHLVIRLQHCSDEAIPIESMSLDPFRPLCALRHLREVDMDVGVVLNNANIEELSMWWPHLEQLNLHTMFDVDSGAGGVSLRGLIPLARNCPRLAQLELGVDTRTPACVGGGRPAGGVQGVALEGLLIRRCPISSRAVGDAARFIADLFPALDGVALSEYDEEYGNPDEDIGWQLVGEAVEEMYCARNGGRRERDY